jgi:hypothetical protein
VDSDAIYAESSFVEHQQKKREVANKNPLPVFVCTVYLGLGSDTELKIGDVVVTREMVWSGGRGERGEEERRWEMGDGDGTDTLHYL